MDHIAQIKSRLPVAEVIGSYIKLERAGSNMRAICPFHKEKTASFNVSPSRDAYYCFGCAKGGDIFTFVQEIEGITFSEALKILADRAGIVLPEKSSQYLSEKKDNKDRLIELMEKTTLILESHLKNHPEVIEYLHNRGLTDDSIAKFRIGFAPLEWRNLYENLKNKGYSDDEIERVKLIKKVEGKGYYDTFRGRVMFPITDASGRVVAFTGRVFGDQKAPDGTSVAKYLNSPESELYDKSSILFGYDRAKLAIRKQDLAIVVEGQMDCIMSHQAGVENTVAISGTALTHNEDSTFRKNQIGLIKRLTNKIVFALDMDNAGVQATIRSSKIALSEGMNVRVIAVPDGKDPADYILTHPLEWQNVILKSEPIITYLLKLYVKNGLKGDTLREKIQKEVFELMNSLNSKMAVAQVVSDVARILSVKEDVVWDDYNSFLKNSSEGQKYTTDVRKNEVVHDREKVVVSPKVMIENEILGLIYWHEGFADSTLNIPESLMLFDKVFEEHGIEKREIDDNEKIKLSIIAESKYSPNLKFEDIIKDLINRLEKEIVSEKCSTLTELILSAQNKEEDTSEYVRQLNLMNKKKKIIEDKITNHKY